MFLIGQIASATWMCEGGREAGLRERVPIGRGVGWMVVYFIAMLRSVCVRAPQSGCEGVSVIKRKTGVWRSNIVKMSAREGMLAPSFVH